MANNKTSDDHNDKTQAAIDYTKKAFSGPTEKQLRQQEEARAKGGLTPSGIRKYYTYQATGTTSPTKTSDIAKAAAEVQRVEAESKARTAALAQAKAEQQAKEQKAAQENAVISKLSKTEQRLLTELEKSRKGQGTFKSEAEFRTALLLEQQVKGTAVPEGINMPLPNKAVSFGTPLDEVLARERAQGVPVGDIFKPAITQAAGLKTSLEAKKPPEVITISKPKETQIQDRIKQLEIQKRYASIEGKRRIAKEQAALNDFLKSSRQDQGKEQILRQTGIAEQLKFKPAPKDSGERFAMLIQRELLTSISQKKSLADEVKSFGTSALQAPGKIYQESKEKETIGTLTALGRGAKQLFKGVIQIPEVMQEQKKVIKLEQEQIGLRLLGIIGGVQPIKEDFLNLQYTQQKARELKVKETESIINAGQIYALTLLPAALDKVAITGAVGLQTYQTVKNPSLENIGALGFLVVTPFILKKVFKSRSYEPKQGTTKVLGTREYMSGKNRVSVKKGTFETRSGEKVFFDERIVTTESGAGIYKVRIRTPEGKLLSDSTGKIKTSYELKPLKNKGVIQEQVMEYNARTEIFPKKGKPLVEYQDGTMRLGKEYINRDVISRETLTNFRRELVTKKGTAISKEIEIAGLKTQGMQSYQSNLRIGTVSREFIKPQSKLSKLSELSQDMFSNKRGTLSVDLNFQGSFGREYLPEVAIAKELIRTPLPNISPIGRTSLLSIQRETAPILPLINLTKSNTRQDSLSYPKYIAGALPRTLYESESRLSTESKLLSLPSNVTRISPEVRTDYLYGANTSANTLSIVDTIARSGVDSKAISTTDSLNVSLPEAAYEGIAGVDTASLTDFPAITSPKRGSRGMPLTSIPVEPIIPFLPSIYIEGKPKQAAKPQRGYDSEVKEGGKFIRTNDKPLTYRSAKDEMAYYVDNSSSARGRVRPTKLKGKVQSKETGYFNITENKFRDFEIKGKTQKKLNDEWIEKKSNRIDTYGEFNQITAKGLKASRNRRRGFI